MFPIYEKGQGRGIGMNIRSFYSRFLEICQDHLNSDRAKAFAFILHELQDDAIIKILNSEGGIVRLDRLSGHEISVFYINSRDKTTINNFNEVFLYSFNIRKKYNLPLIVFFKIKNNDIENVEVRELQENNQLFAFNEIYSAFELYIKKLNKQKPKPGISVKIFKGLSKGAEITYKAGLEILISKIEKKLLGIE